VTLIGRRTLFYAVFFFFLLNFIHFKPLEEMKTGQILVIAASLSLLGCKGNYYSEKDFGSVAKIDSHVHINSANGYFEDQAAADNFVLITLNVDHSDSIAVERQLEWSLESCRKHPGKVFYGATFYFDTAGWGTPAWSRKAIMHLEKNISGGAVTVKLWKNIGMTERDRSGRFIMVDDPYLKPVVDFIISKGLPITGHLGEPRNCWLPLKEMTVRGDSSYFAENPQYHMFLHPEYPSYEDQINARDHLLELHPDLNFIGCHLGSLEWNVDELAKRLDKFPDMVVDMAARICHLQYQSAKDRERVRNFCIKYQDRLLYGTDLSDNDNPDRKGLSEWVHNTWVADWKYFTTDENMTSENFSGTFEGLKLPREVVNKIYHDNAVRWYKLKLN
jgi:predicted TIM-barrel fold metal-dependent hydrolase